MISGAIHGLFLLNKMKVDFMLIGAAKCGTTSLAYILSKHPEVCFSKEKEPHFFSRYEDWQSRLNEYHKLFTPLPNQLLGEGSPYYTLYPEFTGTEDRIFEYNPNTKFIYIIRNPIDRIYSNYKFVHAFNKLKYPLSEMEKEILENPMYLNRSRYFMQINRYLKKFGANQVHICLFEDFISNRQQTLNSICDFLNIRHFGNNESELLDTHQNKTAEVRNLTKWGTIIARFPLIYALPRSIKWQFRSLFEVKMNRFQPMSHSFKSKLTDLLKDDLIQLGAFTGKDLITIWGLKNQ